MGFLHCPQPLFSIVIPTRQRHDTLEHAMRTVLAQGYDSFELVVMDNKSSVETVETVFGFQDPHIRYVRAPERLSMTDNWELGLAHAAGRYTLILGDDDALAPGAFARAETFLKGEKTKLLTWTPPIYGWPNNLIEVNRNKMGLCRLDGVYRIDSKALLQAYYGYHMNVKLNDYQIEGPVMAVHLPMIYKSFVHQDLIAAIQAKTGRYFMDINPDIYSGIVNAYVAGEFMILDRGLSITGSSGHSIGASFDYLGVECDKAETFAVENQSSNIDSTIHPALIESNSGDILVANTLLKAQELFFPDEKDILLNIHGMLMLMTTKINVMSKAYEEKAQTIRTLAAKYQLTIPIPVPAREALPAQANDFTVLEQGSLLWVDCAKFGVENVFDAAALLAKLYPDDALASSAFSLPTRRMAPSEGALSTLPPHLHWSATTFDFSEHAQFARDIILALHATGVSQRLDMPSADRKFVQVLENELFEELPIWQGLVVPMSDEALNTVCIAFQSPRAADGRDTYFACRGAHPEALVFVGITAFSGDRPPENWLSTCQAMDELWVPSMVQREGFIQAGFAPEKVCVIPFGIDVPGFGGWDAAEIKGDAANEGMPNPWPTEKIAHWIQERTAYLLARTIRHSDETPQLATSRPFTFFHQIDWRSPQWSEGIVAYAAAFDAHDAITLILNVDPTQGVSAEEAALKIAGALERSGLSVDSGPDMQLIPLALSEGELDTLYLASDCVLLGEDTNQAERAQRLAVQTRNEMTPQILKDAVFA